jgi:hypothetical protein
MQVGMIVLGGLAGLIFLRAETSTEHVSLGIKVSRKLAIT